MIPDWRELEERLFTLAHDAIEDFARTAPDEEFYGFYMDGNPESGHVVFGLNSEEALHRQIVWYRTRWPDRYHAVDDARLANELRWNPGDWHYQDLPCKGWSEATAALRAAIDEHFRKGQPNDSDGSTRFSARLRETVRRVVMRLEQSGVFDQLRTTPTFRCLSGDQGESDSDPADGSTGRQWLRQALGNANSTRDT